MNQFDFIQDTFNTGIPAAVLKDGLWGLIDSRHDVILEPTYNHLGGFYKNLAVIKKGHLWGYINIKGEEVIPAKYNYAESFSCHNIAKVSKSDGYNVINQNGIELLPQNYRFIRIINDEIIFVSNDSLEWQLYNVKSNIFCSKEKIIFWEPLGNFFLICNSNSKHGLIDASGYTVIECEFNKLSLLADNIVAAFKENGEYFIFDMLTHKKYVLEGIEPNFEKVIRIGKKDYLPYRNKVEEYHFIDTSTYKKVPNKWCDEILAVYCDSLKVRIGTKTGYLYL